MTHQYAISNYLLLVKASKIQRLKHITIRKVLLFALVLLFCTSDAQSVTAFPDFNYLPSPKLTPVIFSFDDKTEKPVRIIIRQKNILDFSAALDSLLPVGSTTYQVTLSVEVPSLIEIEVDSILDQIFIVPGVSSEIRLPQLLNGSHINTNPDLQEIEGYYMAKFNLLGIEREVQEAFQFLRNYPDLDQAVHILDSFAGVQLKLLSARQGILPKWFIQYETKNIENTSLLYKLSIAYNLRDNDILSANNDNIKLIIQEVDSDDEVGLLTPFYLLNLYMVAMLQYCGSDCFTMEDIGLLLRMSAVLRYVGELKNDRIRNALSYQQLLLLNNAPRSLPDSILKGFEAQISDLRYNQRINKHKHPILENKDAPNFYLKDTTEVFHSLQDFKGRVVLLNFWFVGCRPCQEEIPYEKKLVEDLREVPFVLINICMTSREEAWRDLVVREELPGVNLYANENWTMKLSKEYSIAGYPRYVLIDKEGKVMNDKCSRPSSSALLPLIQKYL